MAETEKNGSITDPQPEPIEQLSWISHPMKRRPVVAAIVTVFIVTCGILIQISTNTPWFAGLGMVILFASLAKFYFPTRYILTDQGVTVKTTTQSLTKPWKMYRSYYRDKNGVLLSPFAEPSRLENFRGLYLIFDKNGDEVVAVIDKYVAKQLDNTPDAERPEES